MDYLPFDTISTASFFILSWKIYSDKNIIMDRLSEVNKKKCTLMLVIVSVIDNYWIKYQFLFNLSL
jgi:hypothetical protein